MFLILLISCQSRGKMEMAVVSHSTLGGGLNALALACRGMYAAPSFPRAAISALLSRLHIDSSPFGDQSSIPGTVNTPAIVKIDSY